MKPLLPRSLVDEDEYRGECQHCLLMTEILYCGVCDEALCIDCLAEHDFNCNEYNEEEDIDLALLIEIRAEND